MDSSEATPSTSESAAFVEHANMLRWSESLAGIARTGLGFTQSQYERERFEEILHVAADMRIAVSSANTPGHGSFDELRAEWMKSVGLGVPGYVTPKVAIGAVVGNEKNEILLIQRSDSGHWLYPTGWADIGYSPAEVAVKEVLEETGIECEAIQILGVLDGMRLGFTSVPLYSIVFHCRATGGTLTPHPLEVTDVGWFAHDALPSPIVSVDRWGPQAFAAIRGEAIQTSFDLPRDPVWRTEKPR